MDDVLFPCQRAKTAMQGGFAADILANVIANPNRV